MSGSITLQEAPALPGGCEEKDHVQLYGVQAFDIGL